MEGSQIYAQECLEGHRILDHLLGVELGTVAAAYHANPACMRNHATL